MNNDVASSSDYNTPTDFGSSKDLETSYSEWDEEEPGD